MRMSLVVAVFRLSWAVTTDSLSFASGYSHKRLQTSHVVCWGSWERLSKRNGPPFRFTLGPIGRIVQAVAVEL